MGVGLKIKELRNKAGLTQKDLADKLHVTYQAVSRWENEDVEPSIDTLKEICKIFDCSTDELFGIERKDKSEAAEDNTKVVEKVVVQETKPVLAVCECCNKPIYDGAEINRVEETVLIKHGKTRHRERRQKILCKECNEIRLQKEKEENERKKQEQEKKLKKRRIHSFIWPGLCFALFLIFSILSFSGGFQILGISFLIAAFLSYFFLSVMILNNTFITEMWAEIASWGFVKLSGIIFEFSPDGFAFLIAMKVIFWILGIVLAILSISLATVVAMVLSIFVYPFALRRNLKGIVTEEEK